MPAQEGEVISGTTVAQLQQYSACDISDALLKLEVPAAGFIADLTPYGTAASSSSTSITVAPVYTVLFAAKGAAADDLPPANIPRGEQWADMTSAGSIVVIRQPPGQTNAVCGGIMALRMMVREVRGIVVAGRVRDLAELKSTHLPIWAHGISTVGAGGGSVPWATQVPVSINGAVVCPGDIAVSDPLNGVVVIPRGKVAQVLAMLPGLVAADERVKQDVLKGMPVREAFQLHR